MTRTPSKWTPGPWRWIGTKGDPESKAYLRGKDNAQVLVNFTSLPSEADAKLIASAPALADALRFVSKYFSMQAAKGNEIPSQLVNTVNNALRDAGEEV